MTAVPLLEVTDLVKHFPAGRKMFGAVPMVRAVDGVSFSVAAGRTLGVVGESGCGKTTLARTLLGLERPTSGQARFAGADLFNPAASAQKTVKRRMQVVFQDPYQAFNPRLTVGEIIAEPWRIHADVLPRGEWRSQVADLLRQVGLQPSYADRHPHEFSGGQRQRVGIARALALGPDLIICDEPVSALDVSVQAQVINLLIEIQKSRGVAFIFVAHDLAIVRHISHTVAVMYLGRIVEIGSRDEIFAAPRHPYTQALFAAVAVPDPRARSRPRRLVLKGDPPSPVSPPSGCHFRTRCWKAAPICAEVSPALDSRPQSPHPVACHFPESLSG